MADIAVITGASSGLGVKFLEAVVNRYSYNWCMLESGGM